MGTNAPSQASPAAAFFNNTDTQFNRAFSEQHRCPAPERPDLNVTADATEFGFTGDGRAACEMCRDTAVNCAPTSK